MICNICGNETKDQENCPHCAELNLQTLPHRRSAADREREVKERKLQEREKHDQQTAGAVVQHIEKKPFPVAVAVAGGIILVAILAAIFMQSNSDTNTVGISYQVPYGVNSVEDIDTEDLEMLV